MNYAARILKFILFGFSLRLCDLEMEGVQAEIIAIRQQFANQQQQLAQQQQLIADQQNQLAQQHAQIIARFGRNNTCIDLIFTNSDHVYESGTLNLNYSDHQAIFVTKKKNKMKTDKISFTGRSYRNYNAEEFQNTLKKEIWDELYGLDDPNIAWEFLIKKLSNVLIVYAQKRNSI